MRPFDTQGAFSRAPGSNRVLQLATRGAGATILSGGVGLGIQTVATVVLARLLSPHDFGVVTMVTTFSLLLTNFGLNGFTEAILQHEEMNQSLASNLFWINVGAGLLLAIAFSLAGSLLARFYNERGVAQVAIGLATTIFLTSLAATHLALLKRALRFSALSINDLVARIVSVLVAIILALRGWGYWALVAGCIALPFSVCFGAWALCRWIPALPRRVPGTGALVRFAMNVYARFALNYGGRNLDNLLVGWRFNAAALGAYKKAYDLFALPANQLVTNVSMVAISALSRLCRDTAEYKRYLLSTLSLLAFVGMGMSGALTLIGRDLIYLVLGPRWDTAGWIFTFFAPGIGIMLIYFTHGWIHLSIGRADRSLRWGMVELIVIGAFFIAGLRRGPAGVAVAWTVSYWILTIPAFWYAGQPIHLGIAGVLGAVWKYVSASLVAGVAAAAIQSSFSWMVTLAHASGALLRILIGLGLFSSLYLCLVVLLHGGYAPIRQIKRALQEMTPWRRIAAVSPQEQRAVGR